MFGWLKNRRETPLSGAPAVRRQKSYSAQSGFVYQYFYQGNRSAIREREQGQEFVFEVTVDRKTSFPVSVFVSESVVVDWQNLHNRALSPTERYAIAKMALFQAFDDRRTPGEMREEVRVRTADVRGILDILGIE
ncbi:MAG TPA: hypothetical protein VLE22_26980 [Bryobacteraceae bacterium]|nr:hypothetical protein [Bryobacteraceae bacterium]